MLEGVPGFHHFPDFNRLCDLADVRGWWIELRADERMNIWDKKERRFHRFPILDTLIVRVREDGALVTAERIKDGNLERTAQKTRATLNFLDYA